MVLKRQSTNRQNSPPAQSPWVPTPLCSTADATVAAATATVTDAYSIFNTPFTPFGSKECSNESWGQTLSCCWHCSSLLTLLPSCCSTAWVLLRLISEKAVAAAPSNVTGLFPTLRIYKLTLLREDSASKQTIQRSGVEPRTFGVYFSLERLSLSQLASAGGRA